MAFFDIVGHATSFGDFLFSDVFETVMYWLPESRGTLDALLHACSARVPRSLVRQASDSLRIVCRCHRHIRFCLRLALSNLQFEAVWRYSEPASLRGRPELQRQHPQS